jgi:hypothetical protein
LVKGPTATPVSRDPSVLRGLYLADPLTDE